MNDVVLFPQESDALIWVLNKMGHFTVKSLTLELAKADPKLPQDVIKGVWRGLVLLRIKTFSWLAILGIINSKDKLA